MRDIHLDQTKSSYVNLEVFYKARLWIKCYYVLLEVVPFGNHILRSLGGGMEGGVIMCVPRQGALIGFYLCWT